VINVGAHCCTPFREKWGQSLLFKIPLKKNIPYYTFGLQKRGQSIKMMFKVQSSLFNVWKKYGKRLPKNTRGIAYEKEYINPAFAMFNNNSASYFWN
jgi:hypothetical protein